MYVCKSESSSESSFAQLEIQDFFGTSRKIVFDLDDPYEAKRAKKVLKPKGIRRNRKRVPSKKKASYQQSNLISAFQQPTLNSSPKRKPKNAIKNKALIDNEARDVKKEQLNQEIPNDLEKRDKKYGGIGKKKNQEPSGSKKKSPKKQVTKPVKNPVKKSVKKPIKKPVRKQDKKQEKERENQDQDINSKEKSNNSKLVKNRVQSAQKSPNKISIKTSPSPSPKPPVRLKIVKRTVGSPISNTPRIDENIIDQFGKGGFLDVECPFCKDMVEFEYDDIDEKTLDSTRECYCGAILRISIRNHNPNVFKDLKIDVNKYREHYKTLKNSIRDEYGNFIVSHGWKN